MLHGVDGARQLDSREARQVEGASLALAKLPARAPIADVFEALRLCVPFAAGLFGVLRPSAPDAMVASPVGLPLPVFESWLGTPPDQLALTLAPILRSEAGGMWRDSETITHPLREELDVLRKLEAANLGEGVGYKVMERTSPGHGVEHFMLALIMERSAAVPPRAKAMLAALNSSISDAILRIRLPFLQSDSIRAQMDAERSTGYVWMSRDGNMIAANNRAHELVTRFRDTLRIPGGRGVVTGFAALARGLAGRSRTWRHEGDGPPSLLQVRSHALAKETHDLHEDMHLVALEEIPLPKSRADELIEQVKLTPTQKKIAHLLAHTQLSAKQIAAKLSRSTRTVEGHANCVYGKLGVEGRQELLRLAAK